VETMMQRVVDPVNWEKDLAIKAERRGKIKPYVHNKKFNSYVIITSMNQKH